LCRTLVPDPDADGATGAVGCAVNTEYSIIAYIYILVLYRQHTSCKNISYVTVKPELQAININITYPVRFPGGVGAKILESTRQAAQ
jgi:hypothetical protein